MRWIALLMVLIVVGSCGGCLDFLHREKTVPSTPTSVTPTAEQYPELKALMDVHIGGAPRAGEPLNVSLTITNVGTVPITREKVLITAKVLELNSRRANLILRVMSAEQKTRQYTLDIRSLIGPNESAVLRKSVFIPAEIKGMSLAGRYEVRMALYVQAEGTGLKHVDSHTMELTLT